MKDSTYEAVIGLEVHIQLSTRSKAFCSDAASFTTHPNTQVSAISLAHPGTLPRVNRMQIESAIKLGLALGCDINRETYFDRKHYFYADLPKGFQTTQDGQPICVGGLVKFLDDEIKKTCEIHHIHMEEDAGKSLHDIEDHHSLIDLNRAGVPLLELVTQPDLHSADEVFHFIHALRKLVRFLDISDGNMEEGSLRCDVNVSVRKRGFMGLNPRCEIKNINSARFARRATKYEIERQIAKIKRGEEIVQDTREFLPQKGITRSLRGKEDAHDYRYFPEPDLPLIVVNQNQIDDIKSRLPELPIELYEKFRTKHQLDHADAMVLTETSELAAFYESVLNSAPAVSSVSLAKLFVNRCIPYLNENELKPDEFPLSYSQITSFLELLNNGKIVKSIAYQKLWPVLLDKPQHVEHLAVELGLLGGTDENTITKLIDEVMTENPDQVQKYLNGKKAILGFFIGQVMRKANGKADPALLRKSLLGALQKPQK